MKSRRANNSLWSQPSRLCPGLSTLHFAWLCRGGLDSNIYVVEVDDPVAVVVLVGVEIGAFVALLLLEVGDPVVVVWIQNS